MNFYNEHDAYAAAWLRNLIAAGHIAPGVVDERSIEDISPHELTRYIQCHFFAGIGVWSLALRNAGWPDDRPVWTGSCPCQPFSAAGKGGGFADERHLWPAWHYLIAERRPATVFGEQVASAAVAPWIDLVQTDMEGLGYAVGAVPFPSAGIGAPHIRDRCYFVAHASSARCSEQWRQRHEPERLAETGSAGLVAHAERADLRGEGLESARRAPSRVQGTDGQRKRLRLDAGPSGSALAGFWAAADWIACRDGKWRPVEPGTFPLAHGAAARVGRLRAYGNAINAEAAREWIETYLDAERA